MGDPTAAGLLKASTQATEEGVFLTANLLGRRLVLAGPDVNSLQVLWSDAASSPTTRVSEIW